MRLRLLLPLLLAALLPLTAQADSLADALTRPGRSAADLERDHRDRPEQVLAFAGFKPGMRIADVFGGGGYYSEILSAVVGAKGEVHLVNNAPFDGYVKQDLAIRLAGNRLPNVHYAIAPNEALGLGKADLDGALMVMALHDIYYADPANDWAAIDVDGFIGQIVAALKPGGVLLIVDHAAADTSGSRDAKALHRIDEAFVRSQLEARGLAYAGSLDVLRNAADDRSKSVFDPAIRGKTDRFVQLYRKP